MNEEAWIFQNDPFLMVWRAFKNLYPDKNCNCFWEPNIRNNEKDEECCGLTDFDVETGEVSVFIKPSLSVFDAVEIFAHELAHVAVGVEHDHDDAWEKAFEDIFIEYNRIGEMMFPNKQTQEEDND